MQLSELEKQHLDVMTQDAKAVLEKWLKSEVHTCSQIMALRKTDMDEINYSRGRIATANRLLRLLKSTEQPVGDADDDDIGHLLDYD